MLQQKLRPVCQATDRHTHTQTTMLDLYAWFGKATSAHKYLQVSHWPITVTFVFLTISPISLLHVGCISKCKSITIFSAPFGFANTSMKCLLEWVQLLHCNSLYNNQLAVCFHNTFTTPLVLFILKGTYRSMGPELIVNYFCRAQICWCVTCDTLPFFFFNLKVWDIDMIDK